MAKGRKTGGRTKGTPNKVTAAAREFFQTFLERNHEKAQQLWEQVAANDPAKALTLLWDASERVVPKLGRMEHTGGEGGPVEFVIRDLAREAAKGDRDP